MDTSTHTKKAMLVAVAAAAALLMLASAAFACTNYRGKLIVTGSAGGTVTAIGLNQTGGMNHCSDPRLTGPAQVDQDLSAVPPKVTGTVEIVTDSATCSAGGGGASQLDEGNYTVSWASEFAFDCMAQVGGVPLYVDSKLLHIDANGDTDGTLAERTYTIPALSTDAGNYAGLCITSTTQSGAPQGNKAPILVI